MAEKTPRGEAKGSLSHLPLRNEAYWVLRGLFTAGTWTAYNLKEAWQRPVRHNKQIEREALFHAVDLTALCIDALRNHSSVLLPSATTPHRRHTLQAAVRTASSILPFSLAELSALQAEQEGNFLFETEEAISTPELVARWHEWVWKDCDGAATRNVETLGGSAVLAASGVQLGRVIPRIIDL